MRAKILSTLVLFLLTFQVLMPAAKTYSFPAEGSVASSGDDDWIIDISVTVEVRCKFEIHNGRVRISLGDQLKELVEVVVGSARLPSVLRSGEKASAGLRARIPRFTKLARLDLPVTVDFETLDSLGGYQSFSISRSARIDIPPEKRTVDLLFSLDETNCVKKLEWTGPPVITPRKEKPVIRAPFTVTNTFEVKSSSAERVDVLVSSSIWPGVQSSVTRYASDLSAGYSVYVYTITYGTPEQVRSFLQGHLTLGLKGCLLVGEIPYAMYFILAHEGWANDTFPCDLFYMDLNGVWTDTNGDGIYEDHSGDMAPEIWVGRIMPTGMGDEVTLTNNYFNKNHAFRISMMSVPRRALVYVDDDWTGMADGVNTSMQQIYSSTTEVKDPATTNASDYVSRLALGYEWVHLQCHGWPGGHTFKTPSGWDGSVFSSDYVSLDPRVLFYQFFVCSGARFTEDNYLAGASVFKTSYGLLSIGSTKTGSMLYFEDFYTQVATSKDIGTAFRTWFVAYGEAYAWSRDWFYGLTIIGDPTLTPVHAQIAFISSSGSSAELYAVKQDGTPLKRLTYNSVPESGPSISADGQWVAFISGNNTSAELYVVCRDGSSFRRLTYNSVPESSPAISGDGEWITFVSGSGSSAEMYVVKRDGTGLRRLTYNSQPESNPVISGDGQWIAFIHGSGSSAELYVIKPDGTGLRRLTYNSLPESSPSISGDGYRIAFTCGSDSSAELYVIGRDGTGLKRLTYNSVADSSPSISHDGQWVAWINNAGSSSELYVIKTDGTSLKRLTYNSAAESSPSISGDGQWIAFISGSDTSAELYVIARDGSSFKRLTYNSVPESSPSIS